MSQYYSERELGPKPRNSYEVTPAIWGGIISLINTSLQNANFAEYFPEECPDGGAICGTNINDFINTLKAEIPELNWPLEQDNPPSIVYIMDLIEFCYEYISEAIQGNYHSFFRHYHYSFNRENGKLAFQERINRIFSRNGLGFQIDSNGKIERIIDPILEYEIVNYYQYSSDSGLNELIKSAITKFKDKNPETRKESLEKLWDAWERLKTIYPELDKKQSITKILETVSPEKSFRDTLENEARELTKIGNSFQIRHSETTQIKLEKYQYIDYLFHRLYSMINLILKSL